MGTCSSTLYCTGPPLWLALPLCTAILPPSLFLFLFSLIEVAHTTVSSRCLQHAILCSSTLTITHCLPLNNASKRQPQLLPTNATFENMISCSFSSSCLCPSPSPFHPHLLPSSWSALLRSLLTRQCAWRTPLWTHAPLRSRIVRASCRSTRPRSGSPPVHEYLMLVVHRRTLFQNMNKEMCGEHSLVCHGIRAETKQWPRGVPPWFRSLLGMQMFKVNFFFFFCLSPPQMVTT